MYTFSKWKQSRSKQGTFASSFNKQSKQLFFVEIQPQFEAAQVAFFGEVLGAWVAYRWVKSFFSIESMIIHVGISCKDSPNLLYASG